MRTIGDHPGQASSNVWQKVLELQEKREELAQVRGEDPGVNRHGLPGIPGISGIFVFSEDI